MQAPERAFDVFVFLCVGMRPDHNDQHLNISGDDGRERRAFDAQFRKSPVTEYQQPVQAQVCDDRYNTCDHRYPGIAHFLLHARVDLRQRERGQAPEHDEQVSPAELEGSGYITFAALAQQIVIDQCIARDNEYQYRDNADRHADNEFQPEGIPHAFPVPAPEILRSEYPDAGNRAEQAERVHKHELIDYRDSGHLLGPELSDHDIVQKAHEIRDAVLYHHRDCDPEYHCVKFPVSYQLADAAPVFCRVHDNLR